MTRLHPALTRRLLAFCLPLLLLLAQQGAVVHALSHLRAPAAASTAKAHQHSQADSACELCLAYAAVGHAVSAQPVVMAQVPLAQVLTDLSAGHSLPADAPAPRSRAPPLTA
jgi:hypothetical protein